LGGEMMNEIKSVCILGSGGREHAIGYAFQKLGVDLFSIQETPVQRK